MQGHSPSMHFFWLSSSGTFPNEIATLHFGGIACFNAAKRCKTLVDVFHQQAILIGMHRQHPLCHSLRQKLQGNGLRKSIFRRQGKLCLSKRRRTKGTHSIV